MLSYVKIFLDWREETALLSDAERGRLINAVVAYASGEADAENALTGSERFLFPAFRLKVDREKAAYATKQANGKKGGAPKGNRNAAKQPETTKNNKENEKEQEKEQKILFSPQSGGRECAAEAAPEKGDSPEAAPPPAKKAKKEYPTGFEAFWEAYPRKTGKGEAYKCYAARLKDGWSPEELLEAAQNYAQEMARRHTELQYIKHAKTFLSSDTPFTDFLPRRVVPEQQRFDEECPFADWE